MSGDYTKNTGCSLPCSHQGLSKWVLHYVKIFHISSANNPKIKRYLQYPGDINGENGVSKSNFSFVMKSSERKKRSTVLQSHFSYVHDTPSPNIFKFYRFIYIMFNIHRISSFSKQNYSTLGLE